MRAIAWVALQWTLDSVLVTVQAKWCQTWQRHWQGFGKLWTVGKESVPASWGSRLESTAILTWHAIPASTCRLWVYLTWGGKLVRALPTPSSRSEPRRQTLMQSIPQMANWISHFYTNKIHCVNASAFEVFMNVFVNLFTLDGARLAVSPCFQSLCSARLRLKGSWLQHRT